MQKTPLSHILREEFVRAMAFAMSLFLIFSLTFASMAYAADGGVFGDILNKILASGNWENPGDGMVKNSAKLGGVDATGYVKVKPNQTCTANQCIFGFNTDGSVKCH